MADRVHTFLSESAVAEFQAVRQYTAHAAIQQFAGFSKLANHSKEEAREELGHADRLLQRLCLLGGTPPDTSVVPATVKPDVLQQLKSDLALELSGRERYNAAIAAARDAGDNGSKLVFELILSDEEGHIAWLQSQLNAIERVGLENYLANLIE